MPTYTVTCTHPKTAEDYPVDVTAANPREAIATLNAGGHITGAINLRDATPAGFTEASAPADATLVELRAINSNLLALRADGVALRQARAVRAPIGTIATAILIAFACWTLLGFFTFVGYLGWVNSRPKIYDKPVAPPAARPGR